MVWWEVEREREREREREKILDSLRNLEVPSGARGASGHYSPTFDPNPPFSKHPSLTDLLAAEEQ